MVHKYSSRFSLCIAIYRNELCGKCHVILKTKKKNTATVGLGLKWNILLYKSQLFDEMERSVLWNNIWYIFALLFSNFMFTICIRHVFLSHKRYVCFFFNSKRIRFSTTLLMINTYTDKCICSQTNILLSILIFCRVPENVGKSIDFIMMIEFVSISGRFVVYVPVEFFFVFLATKHNWN